MESPSSARRVTRSQTLAALSSSAKHTSNKMEDSERELSKSRPKTTNQDRSALIDITNDSPIVGLASGSLETPELSAAKQRSRRCPGSGEALLRGQVKTLLQRVEEETEISKFCLEFCRPLVNDFQAFVNFPPTTTLAPTPANTPHMFAEDQVGSLGSFLKSPTEDHSKISQGDNATDSEEDKNLISRSLFMDFFESTDSSSDCSSVVTYQGTEVTVEQEIHGESASAEDDNASIRSVQVNASTRDEDEEEDEVIQDNVEGEEEDDYGEEDEEEDGGMLDELCEGMSKISVDGEKKTDEGMTFKGKHIRFVYDSDDKLLVEEEKQPSAADDFSEEFSIP